MKITHEVLTGIKVLFRTPDTMTLYGIPYEMREGQQPGSLWRAYKNYQPPKVGHYGSKRIDISDWVYLGEPGWYSTLSQEEIQLVKCYIEEKRKEGLVPGGPYEWNRLSQQ